MIPDKALKYKDFLGMELLPISHLAGYHDGMETEGLLTAREAAQELGVHTGTVHKAFQECRLPFVALYGRKLISRQALEAYKRRTRPDGEKPKGRPRKVQEALSE